MRSECMAASPQTVCSYTWKVPPARPALFKRAQSIIARSEENSGRAAARAGHPSITWKAYLATREFQNLASDLADAFFAGASGADPGGAAVRPASFLLEGRATRRAAEKPASGMLVPALRTDEKAAPQEPVPGKQALDLPIAA